MTRLQIQQEASRLHNPQLAERTGNVFKLWEDGEVTMEKSGLGVSGRTLFPICPPCGENIGMPVVTENGHSYAMLEADDAERLSDAMTILLD